MTIVFPPTLHSRTHKPEQLHRSLTGLNRITRSELRRGECGVCCITAHLQAARQPWSKHADLEYTRQGIVHEDKAAVVLLFVQQITCSWLHFQRKGRAKCPFSAEDKDGWISSTQEQTTHNRYIYLLYWTLRMPCLPLNSLTVLFALIGLVKHTGFLTPMHWLSDQNRQLQWKIFSWIQSLHPAKNTSFTLANVNKT